MAKKSKEGGAKLVSGESSGFGMVLGAIVAIVAVVALIILLSGEMTGQAASFSNIPENQCTAQCPPGSVGKPIGHEGLNGYTYCLCKQP